MRRMTLFTALLGSAVLLAACGPSAAPAASSQRGQADKYIETFNADMPAWTAAGEAAAKCPDTDLACFRSAVQQVHDANQKMQQDLAALPVPRCIQGGAGAVSQTLSAADQAIHEMMDGIDRNDANLLTKGANDMTAAGTQFGAVTVSDKTC